MDAREIRNTVMCKEKLLTDYRELLHKIAISDTLIEMDNNQAEAANLVRAMHAHRMLNEEDVNNMLSTVNVFVFHQSRKILEKYE